MSDAYRHEIDGLRAIAVLSVVLYHGSAELVPGGFVGVDIFFVLSGYLITRILMQDAKSGGISIAKFYARRIQRIFPALFFMLAGVCGVGWFLFLPDTYVQTAESMTAAVLWVANWYFLSELDYFSPAAEKHPLLHLWSLSVEEQFYVVFPLVLMGGIRFFPKRLFVVCLAALVFSFVASCVFVLGNKEKFAFYATHLRAWELLAGALLAIHVPKSRIATSASGLCALLGVGLLVAAIFGYSSLTPFPGVAALAPIVGTVLLLVSTRNRPQGLETRVLSWAPLRAIGLVSYSWYLWHWPVLVIVRHLSITEPPHAYLLAAALLSIVPAILSWRFVERPFRTPRVKSGGTTKPIAVGISISAVFCAFAVSVMQTSGFENRLPETAWIALKASKDISAVEKCHADYRVAWSVKARTCRLGPVDQSDNPTFLVWGDSHAQAMSPAFDRAAELMGTNGILVARGGCPPLIGINQNRQGFHDCAETFDGILGALKRNPDLTHVFLVARWAIYATGTRYLREVGAPVTIIDRDRLDDTLRPNSEVFNRGLDRTLTKLSALGVQVYFVAQVPEAEGSVPHAQARSIWNNTPFTLDPLRSDYDARQVTVNRALMSAATPIRKIELWPLMCDEVVCPLVRNGVPIYRDGNHLTQKASLALAPAIAAYLPGRD